MDRANLVFLDTETTGTGPNDRLCQVAYKFQGREHEALFCPPLPIEIEAMAVSHITNRMVEGKDVFLESKMRQDLEEIFSSGNILVAHNASFDVTMLQRENLAVKKVIDTYKLAQYLDVDGKIPRYAMQYLRYYHDLQVSDAPAHNALGDIRVLEKLFDHYFQDFSRSLKNDEEVISAMLDVSSRPVLIKKFTFGKYAGMPVADVAARDKGYLTWLLNEKIKRKEDDGDDDEDWIHTLKHYLL